MTTMTTQKLGHKSRCWIRFISLKKKNTLREISMLIGYGFLIEAFQIFNKIKKEIKDNNKNKLKIFFKEHIPKPIYKTL